MTIKEFIKTLQKYPEDTVMDYVMAYYKDINKTDFNLDLFDMFERGDLIGNGKKLTLWCEE